MRNTFVNDPNSASMQRQILENKFNSSRANLLLVVGFTLVNILLCVSGSGTYFLFSASIPYFIVDLGLLLTGKYPPEFYVGEFEGAAVLDPSASIVFTLIAVCITLIYLVCWFLSKKRRDWLIAALILFVIDTIAMFVLFGISIDMIFDIVFHGYVIWILISGIRANNTLKMLPPYDFVPFGAPNFTVEHISGEDAPANTEPAMADTEQVEDTTAEAVVEDAPANDESAVSDASEDT